MSTLTSDPCHSVSSSSHDGTAHSRRWRVLAAGTLANAAFSMVFNGIPMTAIMLRSQYSLDTFSLGLALGVMGLGIALSELPWGMLTDRWGDRPVLLLGLSGTAAALVALAIWGAPHGGYTPAFALLCGGLLLLGLLGGSVNGASGRAIMAWFGPKERGLAMSIRQTGIPTGGALGALFLPWLARASGFGAVFALLAICSLLSLALVWAWVQDPPHHNEAEMAPSNAVKASRTSALHRPGIWRMSLGIGVLCIPQFAILSFGSIFLHDFAHLGFTAIAAVMVSLQLGAMIMRVWSGYWTDKHGNRTPYLRACTVLSVILFAVLALAAAANAPGPLLAVILALCGIAVSAWHGVAYAELATEAGAAQTGTALGLANTLVFIANFLTPLGIAWLLHAQRWDWVWWAAGAFALSALPLIAARAKRA